MNPEGNECLHQRLYFGSGDFYLFCQDCGFSWRIEDQHPDNIGAAKSLSGEIRAAITEQPLSRQWREEAKKAHEYANEHEENVGVPIVAPFRAEGNALFRCAADLDNYHDEGRELLREAMLEIETDNWQGNTVADRIRKHLEGDSDES